MGRPRVLDAGGASCGGDSYDAKCYLKAHNLGKCSPLKCTCAGTNGRAPAPTVQLSWERELLCDGLLYRQEAAPGEETGSRR